MTKGSDYAYQVPNSNIFEEKPASNPESPFFL